MLHGLITLWLVVCLAIILAWAACFYRPAEAKVRVQPLGECTYHYAAMWARDEFPRPLPYGSAALAFFLAVQAKCNEEGDWRNE